MKKKLSKEEEDYIRANSSMQTPKDGGATIITICKSCKFFNKATQVPWCESCDLYLDGEIDGHEHGKAMWANTCAFHEPKEEL